MNYIVYNWNGKILRQVQCPSSQKDFQARDGEFVMEGTANDVTQKIKNPGIGGVVIDKTPAEIDSEKPPVISFEKQRAHITNEQWQDVLDRLDKLDNRSIKNGE